MATAAFRGAITAFQAPTKTSRSQRARVQVSCSALPENVDRRSLLAGIAGSLAVLPMLTPSAAEAKLVDKIVPAKSLSSFQRADVLAYYQKTVEAELRKVLTIADAPAAFRLLLADAATYDAATGTGGVNGSIVLSEELNRPENKGLKELVDRLAGVRDTIEAAKSKATPQGAPSWADTIVLAVKITQEKAWYQDKLEKNPINGKFMADNYGTPISVRLGRVDATTPDPPSKLPGPDASPAEVKAFFSTLGVKDPSAPVGPFAPKAKFWERPAFLVWTEAQADPAAARAALGTDESFKKWAVKYEKSIKAGFRTDYEIDLIDFMNRLADLGAKFNKDAYLVDIIMKVPDQL